MAVGTETSRPIIYLGRSTNKRPVSGNSSLLCTRNNILQA